MHSSWPFTATAARPLRPQEGWAYEGDSGRPRGRDGTCASPMSLLQRKLAPFATASHELLASRALLRRVDTKHVIHVSSLPEFVPLLSRDYALMPVPTGLIATYHSLYLDSEDLRCFHDHRRGRRLRRKVRFRHYPDRELSFLEVKTKRNDFLTEKRRLNVPYGHKDLGDRELEFLSESLGPNDLPLSPVSYITYRRVLLLGISENERVTIDFDIQIMDLDGVRRRLESVAVIEVKQPRFSRATTVMRALRDGNIRRSGMSKYAVSVLLARPEERKNRLLPSLRRLGAIGTKGTSS